MNNIEIIKAVEVLKSAEIVREYLLDKECTKTRYYDSENGDAVIMSVEDIDDFDDGLIQLIGYLSAKVDELREE